ncbi:uncharacterized protein E0L32_008424 [Thyridium curvatum]|uniref:Uncharacterized protein n=1 Tax=Thyridium curvatum TaxID=1093900 RepID=A0A507B2B9_9PEZI|nr:uncharacterized protein E0L32_008424 [Thyridium curvatum]TPX10690.1 hypothetical protein E0L32_008424 [Thyridium curvatum]
MSHSLQYQAFGRRVIDPAATVGQIMENHGQDASSSLYAIRSWTQTRPENLVQQTEADSSGALEYPMPTSLSQEGLMSDYQYPAYLPDNLPLCDSAAPHNLAFGASLSASIPDHGISPTGFLQQDGNFDNNPQFTVPQLEPAAGSNTFDSSTLPSFSPHQLQNFVIPSDIYNAREDLVQNIRDATDSSATLAHRLQQAVEPSFAPNSGQITHPRGSFAKAGNSDNRKASHSTSATEMFQARILQSRQDATFSCVNDSQIEFDRLFDSGHKYYLPVDNKQRSLEIHLGRILRHIGLGFPQAPLIKPKTVLDLGTGTGGWAMEGKSHSFGKDHLFDTVALG